MSLYSIIKSLQETPSTNDKLEIMKANKGNELFKEYMRLCTCPSISFYITAKTLPDFTKVGEDTLESTTLLYDVWQLYKRHKTGNDAKSWIQYAGNFFNADSQELFKMLLLKDIRAKVGVTLVNKVWPDLCVDVPYQRCSLPDEKTLKKFNNGETFIVQTKGDGMFASLVLDITDWSNSASLFTRNGNKFPQWFAEYISDGLNDNQAVYEGELLCFRNGEMLSRKEGNGILNSVMQGGEKPEDVSVEYHVWNRLPLTDWKAGKTNKTYKECWEHLWVSLCDSNSNIQIIDYKHVESLQQAYSFNQEQLAKGLEGSIIKTLSHKWKNGTSKECLKLKIEAEIDLVWYDSTEGLGKAAEMLGAMRLRSSCGNVVVDCGTGFTDAQRKELWEQRHTLHGKIVTVKANDLLSKEGSDKMSLFLPVHLEIRTDKDEADSLERIEQIFQAIKNGEMLYE